MVRGAFVGATPGGLAEPVRRHLTTECEFLLTDERGVAGVLPEVEVDRIARGESPLSLVPTSSS